MSSERRIVQLAGSYAQFALDNEGNIWTWTHEGWVESGRNPLPQPVVPQPTKPGRKGKADV